MLDPNLDKVIKPVSLSCKQDNAIFKLDVRPESKPKGVIAEKIIEEIDRSEEGLKLDLGPDGHVYNELNCQYMLDGREEEI